MNYVVLEKSNKIKVKVPVHLHSGRVIMGYRYKGLSKPFQKKKRVLLKDLNLPHFALSVSPYQYLLNKKAVEIGLLGEEPDFDPTKEIGDKYQGVDDKIDRITDDLDDVEYYLDGIHNDLSEAREEKRFKKVRKLKKQLKKTKTKMKLLKIKRKELQKEKKKIGLEYKEKEKEYKEKEKELKVRLSRLPSDTGLKVQGDKAIKYALKKAGFDKIKAPWHEYSSTIKPREWLDAWASSSNDDGEDVADVLQLAMSRRLPENTYSIPPGVKSLVKVMNDAERRMRSKYDAKVGMKEVEKYERIMKAADVVLDTIYYRAQKILRNMGYGPNDSIFLYRGMHLYGKLSKRKVYDLKKFKSNPLSSWSADPDTAEGFGNRLLVTKIRTKDIFSVYLTGLGCKNESEIIIPSAAIGYFKVLR